MQGLVAVGTATGRPGIRQLAGIAAGWFFGQNASGAAVYDPATGVTRDGVSRDGVVNRNSGAESTIHGLLTMQVLDANPDLAGLARASASIRVRDGLQLVEAENGVLGAGAVVVDTGLDVDRRVPVEWELRRCRTGEHGDVDAPGQRSAAFGSTGGGTDTRLARHEHADLGTNRHSAESCSERSVSRAMHPRPPN